VVLLLIYRSLLTAHLGLSLCFPSGSPPGDKELECTVLEVVEFAEVPKARRDQHVMCAICLNEFDGPDRVLPLRCGHLYHAECLRKWLEQSQTCPLRCSEDVLQLPGGCRSPPPSAARWGSAGWGPVPDEEAPVDPEASAPAQAEQAGESGTQAVRSGEEVAGLRENGLAVCV